MSTAAERPLSERGTSNRVLWFGVLGGAAAWSIDHLAALSWHQDYCAARERPDFTTVSSGMSSAILVAISVLMLAVTSSALYTSWRARAALGEDDGCGITDIDRRRFMATAGIWMSVLFAYGIVLRGITVLFLSSNICGR